MKYGHIIQTVVGGCWAIVPEKLYAIVDVLGRRAAGVEISADEIKQAVEAKRKAENQSRGNIGIIQVFGTIAQRMNMMDEMSGGTSAEFIGNALDSMLSDAGISRIVLQIDSPGGSVYGIQELADKIYNSRDRKPISAIADSLAASAAYWIGSQAEKLYVTPSGEVGSVGVLAVHMDQSAFNEKIGVKPSYIHAGKYKVEANPDAPLADDARAAIQSRVDDYYGAFVKAVARGRGTTQVDVRDNYGEGRVVGAQDAMKYGMVDGVKSMDQLLSDMMSGRKGRMSAETARRKLAQNT